MPRSKRKASPPYDAVILVDMQEDFVVGLRKGSRERILPAQLGVLETCTQHDVPVAVLEFEGYGQTLPELRAALERVPRKVECLKWMDCGFYDTQLAAALKSWNASNLLLMGVNAEYCVLSTAQSALRRGYQILTSPSLIAGMPHHDPKDGIPWYSRNGTILAL